MKRLLLRKAYFPVNKLLCKIVLHVPVLDSEASANYVPVVRALDGGSMRKASSTCCLATFPANSPLHKRFRNPPFRLSGLIFCCDWRLTAHGSRCVSPLLRQCLFQTNTNSHHQQPIGVATRCPSGWFARAASARPGIFGCSLAYLDSSIRIRRKKSST